MKVDLIRIAKLTTEPQLPPGFRFEVDESTSGRAEIFLIHEDEPIGELTLNLHEQHNPDLDDYCKDGLSQLSKHLKNDRLHLARVRDVHIDSRFRNTGLGKLLYEKALHFASEYDSAVTLDACFETGQTSQEAKRVWHSLATKYVNSNNIFYFKPGKELTGSTHAAV